MQIPETFLHYLFEQQLISNTEFEIISPGQKNTDAGPDFFNAKIKIDQTIWAGNVEIHIKSSDWRRHHHHNDKAYDNIILHLVLVKDAEILSSTGQIIPTFELKFDKQLFHKYESLVNNIKWIHCEDQLHHVDSFAKNNYIESLCIDRLQQKNSFYNQLIKFNRNNWEESFYQSLAKGFGGKTNSIPFELTAKSLSLKILLKHRDNLLQIEALLFGQAGFLEERFSEDLYYETLQNEYQYLRKKYQLKSIRTELWKFSKIRPYNFPTLKLALFAQLIHSHQSLLSLFLTCNNSNELNLILELKASKYWENHYLFHKTSNKLIKKLGKSSKQHLLINTIIPFLYVYAKKTGQEEVNEKVLNWFSNIEPEDNNITREWMQRGFENTNAMQSQGLIELKNEKCNKHQCIDCRIGHKILTLSWNE